MANLKNTQFATFDAAVWGNRDMVTIGHNRTLIRVERLGQVHLVFRLHGHPIAMHTLHADGRKTLTLDHCGYMTVTTRSAMQNAIALFGYWGNVSFRGGDFAYGVEKAYRGEALTWHKADDRRVTIDMGGEG